MNKLHYVTAEEAVRNIQSGERVFLHSAAATPQLLVDAMTARGKELRGIELGRGKGPLAAPIEHRITLDRLEFVSLDRRDLSRRDGTQIHIFLFVSHHAPPALNFQFFISQ